MFPCYNLCLNLVLLTSTDDSTKILFVLDDIPWYVLVISVFSREHEELLYLMQYLSVKYPMNY